MQVAISLASFLGYGFSLLIAKRFSLLLPDVKKHLINGNEKNKKKTKFLPIPLPLPIPLLLPIPLPIPILLPIDQQTESLDHQYQTSNIDIVLSKFTSFTQSLLWSFFSCYLVAEYYYYYLLKLIN